jgi:hypothetical protein
VDSERGDVGCSRSRWAREKVSPRGARVRGLEPTDRRLVGDVSPDAAALRRSSVALSRASRASSSDV